MEAGFQDCDLLAAGRWYFMMVTYWQQGAGIVMITYRQQGCCGNLLAQGRWNSKIVTYLHQNDGTS